MAKISVIKSIITSQGYLCDMDDGSIWSCDQNGENWFQEKPINTKLTELFNKRSKEGTSGKKSSGIM